MKISAIVLKSSLKTVRNCHLLNSQWSSSSKLKSYYNEKTKINWNLSSKKLFHYFLKVLNRMSKKLTETLSKIKFKIVKGQMLNLISNLKSKIVLVLDIIIWIVLLQCF